MIPNIILGGALIKYDEMNQGLDFIHSIRNWVGKDRVETDADASKLKVPGICHLMPLKWSYESVIIAHAELNPVNSLINDIEGILVRCKRKAEAGKDLTPAEETLLDSAKQALAVVYGLEGESPADVRNKIGLIRRSLRRNDFDPEPFFSDSSPGETVTAEDLYMNEKVLDLFNRAEVERRDYRRDQNPPNVFFGREKRWSLPKSLFGSAGSDGAAVDRETGSNGVIAVNTLDLNILAILLFTVAGLASLHISLTAKLRKV